ncbi:MAG: ATP-binding cassette domain-containing protein, partial [Clostridia bacterium]|nr:ATP-binding cassette domain-containing protein [Clostridia bacterium]
LLDRICNRIIEIEGGRVSFYDGSYSDYRLIKQAEIGRAESEYERYVKERARLEAALEDRKRLACSITKAPSRMGNSEARLHKGKIKEKQKKAERSAGMIRSRLEMLEPKAKPPEIPRIRPDFTLTDPPMNKIVTGSESLSFRYGEIILFDHAAFEVYGGSKTALVGPNGAGKTTLLRLIASGDARIHSVPKARIGEFRQDFGSLDPKKSVLGNAMDGSVQSEGAVRSVLARLLFRRDDVYKTAGILSGGEKIKLSLARLIVSGCNVLLLDEPTNYLDLDSIEAVESVLLGYEGTVLFVSHDRAFVNAVADRLLVIEGAKIGCFEGGLDEYTRNRRQAPGAQAAESEKLALQMRLAWIAAQLNDKNADTETLEGEYNAAAEQIKKLGRPGD